MTVAEVRLWGTTIGAVSWNDSLGVAEFEYAQAFWAAGVKLPRSRCRWPP